MKSSLKNMFNRAVKFNHQNILNLLDSNPKARLVDLGCDDGVVTKMLANKLGSKSVYVVDINKKPLLAAKKKGFQIYSFDLNKKFKLPSNYFDVVHANQVIEHLTDSDNFLAEIKRILKPGGYAIISTENASSWINIWASLWGWQMFSLTNFSNQKESIGNPWALHQNDKQGNSYWNHVRIYNIRGLKEYCKSFGFKVESIVGAGYFPLPAILGKLDVTHAHFITIKVRKK